MIISAYRNIRYFFPAVLLFLSAGFSLCGAADSREMPGTFTGTWKNISGKRICDTPLGTLYQFNYSEPYSTFLERPKDDKGRWMFSPLECALPPAKKGQEGRFVAIDFKIRCYPVLGNKEELQRFEFTLGRSSSTGTGGDFALLDQTVNFRISEPPATESPLCERFAQTIEQKGLPLREPLQPLAYRVVFDTRTQQVLIWENGCRYRLTPQMSGSTARGIGKFSQAPAALVLFVEQAMTQRAPRLLEVSAPLIRRFDDPRLLDRLPPLGYEAYPYERYAAFGAARRDFSRNPDAKFAEALTFLRGEGGGPVEGALALKELAKGNHLLAMRELALCFHRGLGVEKNDEEALRWFEKARKEQYHSRGLASLLLMRQAEDPRFPSQGALLQMEILQNGFSANEYEDEIVRNAWSISTLQGGSRGDVRSGNKPLLSGRWQSEKCALLSNRRMPFLFSRPELAAILAAYPKPPSDDVSYSAEQEEILKNWRESLACGTPHARYQTAELLLLYAADPKFRDDFLRKALALLPEARGYVPAAITELEALWQLNQLKTEHFTEEMDLKMADEPRYLLLKEAVRAPREKWIASYKKRALAPPVPPAGASPESKFIAGLFVLDRNRSYEFPYGRSRLCMEKNGAQVKDAKKIPGFSFCAAFWGEDEQAFSLIEEAAKGGHIGARYLWGHLMLAFPRDPAVPHSWTDDSRKQGLGYMQTLADSGHVAAQYALAEYLWKTRKLTLKEAQLLLEKPCALKSPGAWLLMGHIMEKYNDIPGAGKCYAKAGEYGIPEGYSRAAQLPGVSRANALLLFWREFIRADNEARRFDPGDPYAPEIVVNPDTVGGVGTEWNILVPSGTTTRKTRPSALPRAR